MITRIILVASVLLGLWGAGRLSFDQYQTCEACPILGETVAACYVALTGYVLIGLGVFGSFVSGSSTGKYAFWIGTAIAGGLAAFATVLELTKGDVCPVAFGSVPTCYLSLALGVLIGGLFLGMRRLHAKTHDVDL